jgi:hypothetical protein
MNKQMILLATVAVGAAASAFAPAAQAKGGHGGHHGGHFRFHRVWTPTFERSYEPPVVVRRKVIQKVYVEKKTVAITPKTIDGMGRQYDPAARVWFDGKSQCWSGEEAFALKSGVWFYGDARWYELNGAWKTNVAEAPAAIDCEASPVIAAKLQGNAKPKGETAGKDVGQNTGEQAQPEKKTTAADTPPVKVAAEEPAKPADPPKATECKKYFPSVGEMLTVPCGQ